jgi:hypothetical protein
MALFQNEVASSVKIPVFLSSLMQIPFITNILQPNKKIGVIVANSKLLRGEILTNAGISSVGRLVIGGMEEKQGFLSAIWNEEGVLDTGLIEKEVVEVATFLVSDNPDIGAILLECSDLPPYAAAVKQSLGLPVFDFISMINFVYSSLVKNSYIGTMY